MSLFPDTPAARHRYGRRKVFAILITFALGYAAVKLFVPERSVENLRAFIPGLDPREAFRQQASDVLVEAVGTVDAVLADSLATGAEVATLQRMRVRLDDDFTVLVVHDAEEGGRVRVAAGDSVSVRGAYWWSTVGGVIDGTDGSDPKRLGWVRRR